MPPSNKTLPTMNCKVVCPPKNSALRYLTYRRKTFKLAIFIDEIRFMSTVITESHGFRWKDDFHKS